ncbi:HIT family protein [Streptomyces roseus]|uniref:HIT family protein n=1 Tax=Streptomyces roseus TaxID=66430 RepID=UPI00381EE511
MDCTFCRLIRDDAARWVKRGPVVSAFAPLDPLAPRHTLVVPTSHWTDTFDAPPQVLAQAMTLAQLLAEKMRSELKAGGVDILNAEKPTATGPWPRRGSRCGAAWGRQPARLQRPASSPEVSAAWSCS